MGLFSWLGSCFGSGIGDDTSSMPSTAFETTDINPATGLLMVGGVGGIDVEGNPYGTDLHSQLDLGCTDSIFDDSWSNTACGCSFDDSWTTSSSLDSSSFETSSFDSSSFGSSSWDD